MTSREFFQVSLVSFAHDVLNHLEEVLAAFSETFSSRSVSFEREFSETLLEIKYIIHLASNAEC